MLNVEDKNRPTNLSAGNFEQSKCSKRYVLPSKPATISGISENEAAITHMEYTNRATKTLCNLLKIPYLYILFIDEQEFTTIDKFRARPLY